MNLFCGNPLNRLSWLRPSHAFLNAAIASSATRWLLFKNGDPLIVSHPEKQKRALAHLSTIDVMPLLGSEPFFGQGDGKEQLSDSAGHPALESARHRGTPIVFLGLLEYHVTTDVVFLSSDFKDPLAAIANLDGILYFTLDVADLQPAIVDSVLANSQSVKDGGTLVWMNPTAVMDFLDHSIAGVFAQARAMVDWNQRNKFCPACGAPTYSMWGGWKISCTTHLPWFDRTGRKPCVTEKGLHNFMHPRTDAVVIMVAVDQSGEQILLGKNKRFHGLSSYSALAGFVEPGESFEDAVQREMWEEAGVKVSNVRYHSTQPWPYPANLMVGFYATADSSKPVRVDLDNELEDARWFTREDVLAVLRHPQGTDFLGRNRKASAEERLNTASALAHSDPTSQDIREASGEHVDADRDPPFRVPPSTSIAGVLIKDWAEGTIPKAERLQKGNL